LSPKFDLATDILWSGTLFGQNLVRRRYFRGTLKLQQSLSNKPFLLALRNRPNTELKANVGITNFRGEIKDYHSGLSIEPKLPTGHHCVAFTPGKSQFVQNAKYLYLCPDGQVQ
jgi:hypothetical protein